VIATGDDVRRGALLALRQVAVEGTQGQLVRWCDRVAAALPMCRIQPPTWTMVYYCAQSARTRDHRADRSHLGVLQATAWLS